jgi:hypothetical protein
MSGSIHRCKTFLRIEYARSLNLILLLHHACGESKGKSGDHRIPRAQEVLSWHSLAILEGLWTWSFCDYAKFSNVAPLIQGYKPAKSSTQTQSALKKKEYISVGICFWNF